MSLIGRRMIVGVMGSGREEHPELSAPVGRLIAESGYDLLTGGGKGVMAAVARAFTDSPGRKGISIGVIRADGRFHLGEQSTRPWRGSGPNPYVELAVLTHLPDAGKDGKTDLSRNHINVLTSTVVIVLPGDDGTRTELELAVEYCRPTILFIGSETVGGRGSDEWQHLYRERLHVARDVSALAGELRGAVRQQPTLP